MVMTGTPAPTVQTASGALRGTIENGIAVFRGISYVSPPIGDLRFAPPQPMPKWQGTRDATHDGPIAPQGRSRLAHVMGDFERTQSEDCLTLTLWTPAIDAKKRPVIVWIHGGAFSSGAGSLPWYSGERFAAKTDVVAISLNYRLGALGFMYLPGVTGGNLGLLDQVAALQWVRENIAAFGGDPANVTVVGQSAGAGSIAGMLVMPAAKGLFKRAIMQSTPFGRMARTAADAERIANRFLEILKIKREDAVKLRTMPIEKFIAAQGELGRLEKRFGDLAPPFGLTADGQTLPTNIVKALNDGAGNDVDIMIGTTREELAAFYVIDDEVKTADEAKVRAEFVRMMGPRGNDYYDEYQRFRTDTRPATALADLNTDRVFRMQGLEFGDARAAMGRPVYMFQFDWQSPSSGVESCHCIELPFMFNNFADWPNCLMLKGGDSQMMGRLGHVMQQAWGGFARSGNPDHKDMPPWKPYAKERITMRFGNIIEPVADLAGRNWRLPWPS